MRAPRCKLLRGNNWAISTPASELSLHPRDNVNAYLKETTIVFRMKTYSLMVPVPLYLGYILRIILFSATTVEQIWVAKLQKGKPRIGGTVQLCDACGLAKNGRALCYMGTERGVLKGISLSHAWNQYWEPTTVSVAIYWLYPLCRSPCFFCWQIPTDVTVSQPTHTANGTNG